MKENLSYDYDIFILNPDVQIKYQSHTDSRKNNALKIVLQDFADFDENEDYCIRNISIIIDDIYSNNISTFAIPMQRINNLKINNFNDLLKLIIYTNKFKELVYRFRLDIKAEKNSEIEKLINNFITLLKHIYKEHERKSTGVVNYALDFFFLIPELIFRYYDNWIARNFIEKILLPKSTPRYIINTIKIIGWLICFPLLLVVIPLSPFTSIYGIYKYFQEKKENNQALMEAGIAIENNLTYKKFLDSFGLESDLIIYDKWTKSKQDKYEGDKNKEDKYIITVPVIDKVTEEVTEEDRIVDQLPFTVLPNDIRSNIMTCLSGTKEENIMRQIIEKKKDRTEGIEELKQIRIEKKFLQK